MIRVCCAIVISDKKIMAVQRSEQMTHPLKWEFPGGKLNPGESEEECILRELQEELKLNVSISQRLTSVFHAYGEKELELIPFVASTSDTPELLEHKDIVWLGRDEIEKLDWVEADIKVISILKQLWEIEL
jgi:8-oxo-dGTP diphosphatase